MQDVVTIVNCHRKNSHSATRYVRLCGEPFNAHQSQYIGPRFFGYNSPATIARELLKRFTDAGRLRGSIFLKIF